jgi:hypothetical protein
MLLAERQKNSVIKRGGNFWQLFSKQRFATDSNQQDCWQALMGIWAI